MGVRKLARVGMGNEKSGCLPVSPLTARASLAHHTPHPPTRPARILPSARRRASHAGACRGRARSPRQRVRYAAPRPPRAPASCRARPPGASGRRGSREDEAVGCQLGVPSDNDAPHRLSMTHAVGEWCGLTPKRIRSLYMICTDWYKHLYTATFGRPSQQHTICQLSIHP